MHRDWLNAEIEKRLSRNTSDYWIEKLNEAGVACGRINNLKEVFEEPQVQHLGILKKVTSKHLGRADSDGPARDAHANPLTIARAAPKRGEHSEEILSRNWILPRRSSRMKAAGVF